MTLRKAPHDPPLPQWGMIVASIVIALHLIAVGTLALAAPSGPWPTPMGESFMGSPPAFARSINSVAGPNYLEPLHFTHNYHFPSNRVEPFGIYFEATMKDKKGNVITTVRIPDKEANPAVYERQMRLAQVAANDEMIPPAPTPTQNVAAPDTIPKVPYWGFDYKNYQFVLKEEHAHRIQSIPMRRTQEVEEKMRKGEISDPSKVPNLSMVERPSAWSLSLLRSYSAYLRQKHNAASVEFTRYSQMRIPADVLSQPLPEAMVEMLFSTRVFHYGDVERLESNKGGKPRE